MLTLSQAAAQILGGEPFGIALAAFLHAFFDADPEARQAMIEDTPPGLDDPRLDSLLTAIGEHLALMWGLDVPDWAREPRRLLTEVYVPAALSAPTPGSDLRWVPPAFARRRTVVHGEPLLGDRAPPELDGFLLTPVGALPGHPDLRLHARRGAYSESADPAYASIVVTIPRSGGIGREYALVSLGPPALKLLGIPLSADTFAALTEFVERHRAALLDHWSGATDSLDLLRAIHDGEHRSA